MTHLNAAGIGIVHADGIGVLFALVIRPIMNLPVPANLRQFRGRIGPNAAGFPTADFVVKAKADALRTIPGPRQTGYVSAHEASPLERLLRKQPVAPSIDCAPAKQEPVRRLAEKKGGARREPSEGRDVVGRVS